MPPVRLPAAAASRRSERGVSLVLSIIILTMLIVVLYQVWYLSIIELEQAGHHVSSVRQYHLADASRLQAQSVLLMDIEDAGLGGAEGGGGGLGGGGGGLGGLSGNPGDGGGGGGTGLGGDDGGGGGGAAAVTQSTDSMLDEWMNPAALAPPLGEGLTIYVEVIDEDSKINLLGLWTEDEEKRDEWREIVGTVLDRAFDGTSLDLSSLDVKDILDELDDWVKGDRSLFNRPPLPNLKKSRAEDEAEESELDTDIIENEFVNFPLTLGELLMIEKIQPEHLYGFVEDDEYYPGLERYLTLWSELELKDAEADEDEDFGDSPFAGSVFDDEGDEAEAAEEAALQADATADGRVNVNTAPLVVLRALAPEDIPTSFLERLVEFREQIHELRSEWETGLGEGFDGTFGQAASEGETGAEEGDEDDPTQYVFQSETEVFDKVEDKWELSIFTDDEDKSLFVSRLGVISNVFTIRIHLFDQETGRRASYRTIAWRMTSQDDPRMITLLPLELYADTRRPEDFPEEMEDIGDRRFERRDGEMYDLR